MGNFTLQHPEFSDALAVYRLVKENPPLEPNTAYFYYIMCRDFSETSIVALSGTKLAAFLLAYEQPKSKGSLFVYQMAVSKEFRGKGLALRMLHAIIKEPQFKFTKVEASIAETNLASQKVFQKFAKEKNAVCQVQGFLNSQNFDAASHEQEDLYIIQLGENK